VELAADATSSLSSRGPSVPRHPAQSYRALRDEDVTSGTISNRIWLAVTQPKVLVVRTGWRSGGGHCGGGAQPLVDAAKVIKCVTFEFGALL
jgi:hypothetical protein